MSRLVPNGGLVTVTGASGYIAGHIIEQLLDKGYRVRGVVRDLKNEAKYKHLYRYSKQEGQLEFVQSEIKDGKYGEILRGADALIHTATPYIYTAEDPQRDIVDPAIKGTVDAIQGSLEAGVKRVVITSSGGAIMSIPPPQPGYVFGEKDWNTTSSLTNIPYFYSKKLAEEAAWKLWKENKDKIDVVAVNALFVIGPPKTTILNQSMNTFKKYLTGETTSIQPGYLGWVDVRDAAKAHIIAMEHPEAVGRRVIACSESRPWWEFAETLKKQFPDYPVAQEPVGPKGIPFSFDNSFSKKLGLEYRSFETMIRDTAEQFIQLGIVPDLRKK